MKLGTENRRTTIVAVVLFAIGIFLLVRMWSGGGQPAAAAPAVVATATPTPAPQPARGRRVRPRAPGGRTTVAVPGSSLDPRLRLDLLKQSEDTEYKGTGQNIFVARTEIPKPVAPPVIAKQPPPTPPVYVPPPLPPINLKFFGFANQVGEPKKVLLSQGDDVFVAGEGDIVNRRYKVMKINPNSVEIEDVLSNNRQTIPLTAG